jgi:hypothetical protein
MKVADFEIARPDILSPTFRVFSSAAKKSSVQTAPPSLGKLSARLVDLNYLCVAKSC